jgi:pimeloyl-ACP methyl ester carboxylesterase
VSSGREGVVRWALRAGLVAGGAVATTMVGRRMVRRSGPGNPEDVPLGSLHTTPISVLTEDGVTLCVEVADADRDDPDAPTVVFLPGFCLNMDAWHFQRLDLAGAVRCVFYDQRGHGRSGRGARANATIEQFARDLHAVLEATVPTGPVVLVGHSLGGMVVMAYAQAHPEEFGARVVGAALIATSAGRLAEMTLGLPAAVVRGLWPFSPGVVGVVTNRPMLIKRGIGADRDVGLWVTRRLSFGARDVPPDVVRFAGAILNTTPLDVFGELFPEFDRHDKEAALPVFRGCPTLILAGSKDVLTPADHSRGMAVQVPEAEFTVLDGAGHLLMLECPTEVNAALRRLLERARLAGGRRPSRRAAG